MQYNPPGGINNYSNQAAIGGNLPPQNQYGLNNPMNLQPGAGLAPTMGIGGGQNFATPNMMGNNQMIATNQMMPAQDNNNYHFRFKIALVGDSGVGKTTFLDAISQTLGSVVENEESSELHIKVGTLLHSPNHYFIFTSFL